jgi:hypothetical protein
LLRSRTNGGGLRSGKRLPGGLDGAFGPFFEPIAGGIDRHRPQRLEGGERLFRFDCLPVRLFGVQIARRVGLDADPRYRGRKVIGIPPAKDASREPPFVPNGGTFNRDLQAQGQLS